LGCVFLFPLASRAEEPYVDFPPKPNIIDLQRDYLSDKFLDLASEIDSFFGTKRNFQETDKSMLQLDAAQVMGRNGSQTIALTYQAKFQLPNAQQRFHLMLESNPDQHLPGETLAKQLQPLSIQQASLLREVSTPDSYGASLRFANNVDSHWRFSADGGLKADGGVDLFGISIHPFARSSVSFNTPLDFALLTLTESIFSFNTTGPGENTQLDLDHRYSEKILFRATSGTTFLYDTPDFAWHQDFTIFQTLDQQASLLYQLSTNGVSRPAAEVSEYVALMLYRIRLHNDWVFLELNPQFHYPKASSFVLDAQFIVRLEFMFSK